MEIHTLQPALHRNSQLTRSSLGQTGRSLGGGLQWMGKARHEVQGGQQKDPSQVGVAQGSTTWMSPSSQ
jgi:hypothetical protein